MLPEEPELRTVVVFDWDDTLCPSSWLHAHQLLPTYQGQPVELPPVVSDVLHMLSEKVCDLLEAAQAYGPVFVVTAAEGGWVETACALYMPSVGALLTASPDIHIVSARTWFEGTYGVGGDARHWKLEVLGVIAAKCFGADTAVCNLVSVGDSLAERDACHAAVTGSPHILAKTLKFIDVPDVLEIAHQVELAFGSLHQMCHWRDHLDLHITRDQLP
ncbi:protein kinase [Achlya hypogyna]|uniref:Protein kinase n=1 Tax=Achlya hypogyna TaxID=1202772 RepID=A0A1V9YEK2_ACHHY|nr:protein kinase [Achlya hypogyna]